MLFDWLVAGRVMQANPAHAVRAPSTPSAKARLPVVSAEQMRELLAAIDTTSLLDLRDRALIALMGYTFARVGAATGMEVVQLMIQRRAGSAPSTNQDQRTQLPCDRHHHLPAEGQQAGDCPANAGHESARITGFYDRRNDQIALDEVERIAYQGT